MAAARIQFAEGDTFLHRRHPLAKLVVLALFVTGLLVFESRAVPIAVCALLLAVHLDPRIGLGRFAHVARNYALFGFLIVLANLLLLRQAGTALERISAGLVQALRIFDMLVVMSLFVGVTDPIDLTDVAIRGMRPIDRTGARLGELSLMLMVVFSFLPLMGEEVERLAVAQGTRCGFGRGPVSRIRSAVPLLGALVVGVMRRAEELELSLAARRYSPVAAGGRASGRRITGADCLFGGSAMILFVAGIWAKL